MGLPNTEIVTGVANKVGNTSAVGYAIAWVLDKVSTLDPQDWITLLVGISAIFSYGTAGFLNLKKSRQLNKKKKCEPSQEE